MEQLRNYVFRRDGICVAYAGSVLGQAPAGHECRDRYGMPHGPFELWAMTLAHVPTEGENAFGSRAPDDELHAVVECYGANVLKGPDRELRAWERLWILQHEVAGDS